MNNEIEEEKLYDPVGDWLIQNKGCQRNNFFRGYCKEPKINGRRPDVVGVKYQERDTAIPTYDFHFYFVEVKGRIDSQEINNLKGELDTLKRMNTPARVGLDTAHYYIAFPSDSVSKDIREWARENGIGVLRIEVEERFHPHEAIEPEAFEPESTILPKNAQSSPGVFKKEVEKCPVLRRIMIDKVKFFEQNIRPGKEEYEKELEMKKALRYPADEEVKESVRELVGFIEELNLPIEIEGWRENIFLYKEGETRLEFVLKITPQKRNFKVIDSEGDTICRACSRTEVELNEEMENLEDLKVYVEKTLEEAI